MTAGDVIGGIARSAILWAADNEILRRRVPRYRFVRRTLARFMPGETADSAIEAGKRLSTMGLPTTFTNLGENVTELRQAEAATDHYQHVLDLIEEAALDTEISVKLTHLGLDLDVAQATKNTARLTEHASRSSNFVWIDMESSGYVDRTLDLYADLRSQFDNVGVCVQAYLHRTGADVERLMALGSAIRLVKGAYREPQAVAIHNRRSIDENYLRLAERIIATGMDRGVRLALGTHDISLVERIAAAARSRGKDQSTYEVQMLYGIRAEDQLRLAAEGYRLRTLVAYGSYWYPWFIRRLAERPTNLLFVLRSLLQRS